MQITSYAEDFIHLNKHKYEEEQEFISVNSHIPTKGINCRRTRQF